ncbi:Kynureninase (L-kynurenine hydrolase) [Tilletia horrida]|nr:Kynureninase (L-kynurenine hydrolase) [Tilletia horrida]
MSPASSSSSTFTTAAFEAELGQLAAQHALRSTADARIADLLDARDALAPLRAEYSLPSAAALQSAVQRKQTSQSQSPQTEEASSSLPPPSAQEKVNGDDDNALYLCGNSLGPQPRRARALVERELGVWASVGVLGHFDHPHGQPWVRSDDAVNRLMADLVGAKPAEVAAMGALTANLHVLLATFYRPSSLGDKSGGGGGTPLPRDGSIRRTGSKLRHKIVYEWKAFPSDQYALQSVVRLHGLDPDTSLVALKPRPGEDLLRTDDILATLHTLADEGETAICMLSGIQYYTGQLFDIPLITRTARQLGILVGWDLAHAFGNVPLALHDWDVDFAAWCTYKYGSSGPGGIAGIFVHERWTKGVTAQELPRPAGWYGHNRATRFAMPAQFEAMDGAAGFVSSNPSALDLAVLQGSLETLARAPFLPGARPSSPSSPSAFASASEVKEEEADAFSAARAERINASAEPVGFGLIMPVLRAKSLRLTAYLAHLLLLPDFLPSQASARLVTPHDPAQRGSQLCVRIVDSTSSSSSSSSSSTAHPHVNGDKKEGEEQDDDVPPPLSPSSLLARAHRRAEREHALIVDVRAPDVIRLAPLAQYSTFRDVWHAAHALKDALEKELAADGLEQGQEQGRGQGTK